MNLAGFLLKSRGIPGLAKRVPGLFARFGVTERKIATCLHTFTDITERYDTRPTFAITANLIPRYPKLIRGLQDRGVEFAIHGLVHTDYTQLSFGEQCDHIEKAMRIFSDNGIESSGFRCPYLSSNYDTILAVKEIGLKWESSDVISWDVLDINQYNTHQIDAYRKVNELYGAKSAITERSVPRMIYGLVEIPVSIPDDEALVDRLGVKDRLKISSIWRDILRKSYERGELFTIQLHHERIDFCSEALIQVLKEARRLQPAVWVTQLKGISDWVHEFRGIDLKLDRSGRDRLRVKVDGSKRATVLAKNIELNVPNRDWMSGYRLVEEDDFEVVSKTKPIVGISPLVTTRTIEYLRGEGFITEVSNVPNDYSIYLEDADNISHPDLARAIEESDKPIIRLWRWPNGARSALSCTGDIDSITIIDFARRFTEV